MTEEKRPEWMTSISALVNPDDYLSGRKIDKTFELSLEEKARIARETRDNLIATGKIKLIGDPILDLERRKQQLKYDIITNPIRLRKFRERLLEEDRRAQAGTSQGLSSDKDNEGSNAPGYDHRRGDMRDDESHRSPRSRRRRIRSRSKSKSSSSSSSTSDSTSNSSSSSSSSSEYRRRKSRNFRHHDCEQRLRRDRSPHNDRYHGRSHRHEESKHRRDHRDQRPLSRHYKESSKDQEDCRRHYRENDYRRVSSSRRD